MNDSNGGAEWIAEKIPGNVCGRLCEGVRLCEGDREVEAFILKLGERLLCRSRSVFAQYRRW